MARYDKRARQKSAWAILGLVLLVWWWGKVLEATEKKKLPIAYDPASRRFLTAYHKKGKGLRGRLLDVNGKPISSSFTIFPKATCCDNPLVVFDKPSRRFLVAWIQRNGKGYDTQAQWVNTDGTLFKKNFVIPW